jgi:hypothetical protein
MNLFTVQIIYVEKLLIQISKGKRAGFFKKYVKYHSDNLLRTFFNGGKDTNSPD